MRGLPESISAIAGACASAEKNTHQVLTPRGSTEVSENDHRGFTEDEWIEIVKANEASTKAEYDRQSAERIASLMSKEER
jgi:hypothetical protein